MTISFTIRRANLYATLRCVLNFVPKDSDMLHKIHLAKPSDKGFEFIATDGHILGSVRPFCIPHTVPNYGINLSVESVKAARNAIRHAKYNADEEIVVNHEQGSTKLNLKGAFGEFDISVDTSRYPNFRRVIPEAERRKIASSVMVDPELLARVSKAAREFSGEKLTKLRMTNGPKAGDAIRFDIDEVERGSAIFVLMPLHP